MSSGSSNLTCGADQSRMSKVCEKYSLDELCGMTEEDMDTLLGFYAPGTVPTLEEVRLRESDGAYDGPFLI